MMLQCELCKCKKELKHFSQACKRYLTQDSRSGGWQCEGYRCHSCQHPTCLLCKQETIFAIPHNATIEDKKAPCGPGFYCHACKYPPCKVLQEDGTSLCGKMRDNPGGSKRFETYTCLTCSAKIPKKCSRHGATEIKYLCMQCPRCVRVRS